MATKYWLVKQEPKAYSWDNLVADRKTAWTGVRNYQARNHLRAMQRGDLVLFYHSVSEKQVVGIARVAKTAYPDPTAKEGDWSCAEITPVKRLKKSVSLETMKADPSLKDMALVKHGRLSVTPLTRAQFDQVLSLGKTSS